MEVREGESKRNVEAEGRWDKRKMKVMTLGEGGSNKTRGRWK